MTKYKNFPSSLEKAPWVVTDETGAEYGTQSYRTGEYLYVRVNGLIDVQIKREYEGVVVDLYPLHVVDEPIGTTYGMWGDDPNYDDVVFEKLPDDFNVTDVEGNIYGSKEFHEDESMNHALLIEVKNLSVQLEYDLNTNNFSVSIFPDRQKKSIGSIEENIDRFISA